MGSCCRRPSLLLPRSSRRCIRTAWKRLAKFINCCWARSRCPARRSRRAAWSEIQRRGPHRHSVSHQSRQKTGGRFGGIGRATLPQIRRTSRWRDQYSTLTKNNPRAGTEGPTGSRIPARRRFFDIRARQISLARFEQHAHDVAHHVLQKPAAAHAINQHDRPTAFARDEYTRRTLERPRSSFSSAAAKAEKSAPLRAAAPVPSSRASSSGYG